MDGQTRGREHLTDPYEEGTFLEWRRLLQPALRSWKLILMLGLIGAVAGASLALTRPQYVAEGFYYTPGWSLADHKRFRTEFGGVEALQGYFRRIDIPISESVELLIARSRSAGFWETAVRPLHPMTRKDARDLPEVREKDSAGIIGLQLMLSGRPAEVVRDAVFALGDYLSEMLLLTTLQSWIASGQAGANAEQLKVDNTVLQTKYAVLQAQRRVDDMRQLQVKYPEARQMDTRQVISADASSARYLSPIAQVIALESSIAEANESLRRIERRATQLQIEAWFFDEAAKASKKAKKGSVLLEQLTALREQGFDSRDLSDDAVREVANRFALDLKAFRDQFAIGYGFRSEVLVPTQSVRSPARFAPVGAALGVFLALALAYGRALLAPRTDEFRGPLALAGAA